MLPTNVDESFVCCLSSLNLLHFNEWESTDAVETMIFFLDTVISEFITKSRGLPFMKRAHTFAKRHRALGLGVLGWHSFLQSQMIPFEGLQAQMLNNIVFKSISNKAKEASKDLANRFGTPA